MRCGVRQWCPILNHLLSTAALFYIILKTQNWVGDVKPHFHDVKIIGHLFRVPYFTSSIGDALTNLRSHMWWWLIAWSATWCWLASICRNAKVWLLFHRRHSWRRVKIVLLPWRHELWISTITWTTRRKVWRRGPGLRRGPMLRGRHWLLSLHTIHFHL
jgi:hypothetical protein